MDSHSPLNRLSPVTAYLERIGARLTSVRTAIVREQAGKYWIDTCKIQFSTDGGIVCSDPQYSPSQSEADAIKAAVSAITDWPQSIAANSLDTFPERDAERSDNLFLFHDWNDINKISMVQVRIETADGKAYIPYSYWDDGMWRRCEPEGELPLWGATKISVGATVWLHEGAKSARAVRRIVEAQQTDWPFYEQAKGAVHLGWIGGALNPSRTDWEPLERAKPSLVVIVADNDREGRKAISKVSSQLSCQAICVEFTDAFPVGFDLADPLPPDMFRSVGDRLIYCGPEWQDMLQPATWATDRVLVGSGRSAKWVPVIRDAFCRVWSWLEEPDTYICNLLPWVELSEGQFDKRMKAFSHPGTNVSTLLAHHYEGRKVRKCYDPSTTEIRTVEFGAPAINIYRAPTIVPIEGDAAPFFELIDYMLVQPEERNLVLRWMATLIARPCVRMKYSLLLISEQQGIGKTTLANKILFPLLGHSNCRSITTSAIDSDFNSWAANVRLVVVNEVYEGGWKLGQKIKTYITDDSIDVNEKFQRRQTQRLWCHFILCSNSARALHLEAEDRRFLAPELTEARWPERKFAELYRWIENGGLHSVAYWAHTFGDYVTPGETAPITKSKLRLIDGSQSQAMQDAVALAQQLLATQHPAAVGDHDVMEWVKTRTHERVYDTKHELKRAMKLAGCKVHPDRIKMWGRLQYAILNDAAIRSIEAAEDKVAAVRATCVRAGSLMDDNL